MTKSKSLPWRKKKLVAVLDKLKDKIFGYIWRISAMSAKNEKSNLQKLNGECLELKILSKHIPKKELHSEIVRIVNEANNILKKLKMSQIKLEDIL